MFVKRLFSLAFSPQYYYAHLIVGSAFFILPLHFDRLDVPVSETLQLHISVATISVHLIFGLPCFLDSGLLRLISASLMQSGGFLLICSYHLSLLFTFTFSEMSRLRGCYERIDCEVTLLRRTHFHLSRLDSIVKR